MKKILALMLTLIMLLALCSCGTATEATEVQEAEETAAEEEVVESAEPVGLANPMTEYASLEEINELTGGRLCSPGVMGVSDQTYWTIDCGDHTVAQYLFSVNGTEYSYRFSSVYDTDISGVYTDNGTAFSDSTPSDEAEYYSNDECKLSRWATIDGQYVLMVKDAGSMDEELFKSISEELQSMSSPVMSDGDLAAYYASLEGEYYDSFSQRAVANVTANGSDGILIVVSWGSSAYERSVWSMNATRGEDGLLYYNDCIEEIMTYDEAGNETCTPVEFPASGFFGELDGVLAWTGAGDEQCSQCVFEKGE